ncbi:MerR family transcriptional regulator [Pseudomonas sp. PH1b]|uniref:MerR family transcriptional regulator n=1 Tax=Pseudomonas sp. PH1b TaxID=1397282 RepID=UPI00046ACCDB|nr:MerR family transcriptional regulator [Pseudomonas sp. PH1b]BFD39510.1 MerR family transcriptional regulator [Pseudomonas sp. FFPRI_1]
MYIGQAAHLSGTTIKSIRHYEAIGLLPAPQRQGRYRLYDQQSVEQLLFIKCAQQLGFKLRELQQVFATHQGQGFPWDLAQAAVAAKRHELNLQISALQQLQARLGSFEADLQQAREECPLGSL